MMSGYQSSGFTAFPEVLAQPESIVDLDHKTLKSWVFTERLFGFVGLREHFIELSETRVYLRKKVLLPSLIFSSLGMFGSVWAVGVVLHWHWWIGLIAGILAAVAHFFAQWRNLQLSVLCIHLNAISAVTQANISLPLSWVSRIKIFIGGTILGLIVFDLLEVPEGEVLLSGIFNGVFSLIVVNLILVFNRRGVLFFHVPGALNQSEFSIFVDTADMSVARSTIQDQVQKVIGQHQHNPASSKYDDA